MRPGPGDPRRLAVALVAAVLAPAGEAGRSFLAPAAPNLAHALLFAAALLAR